MSLYQEKIKFEWNFNSLLILLTSWYTAKLKMKSGDAGSDWAAVLSITPFILSQTTLREMFMGSE